MASAMSSAVAVVSTFNSFAVGITHTPLFAPQSSPDDRGLTSFDFPRWLGHSAHRDPWCLFNQGLRRQFEANLTMLWPTTRVTRNNQAASAKLSSGSSKSR